MIYYFTAATIHCECQKIRSAFRVLRDIYICANPDITACAHLSTSLSIILYFITIQNQFVHGLWPQMD